MYLLLVQIFVIFRLYQIIAVSENLICLRKMVTDVAVPGNIFYASNSGVAFVYH